MTRKIFNWIKKHPILSLIASFFIYLGMVDVNFLGLFGKSPGFMSGLEPRISQASEIYSADGVRIGKFFNENRTPVEFKEVNPKFWQALIDTEDERFYKHIGTKTHAEPRPSRNSWRKICSKCARNIPTDF